MSEQPAGTIHDLGYKRYGGVRRAAGTRWRVIARHQVATGWKTWWRFRLALAMAVIATCITGGIMILFAESRSRLGRAQEFVLNMVDTALPESMIWFCRIAFVVTLTIGASIVASDVRSGAFTFYFARSVRPRHYVLGKLVGLVALLALVLIAGPLVVAGLRIGIASDLDEVVPLLPLLWKTLLVGAIATVVYAAVPLGFSALLPSQRHTLALWAAYYLILGEMAHHIGRLSSGAIAAIDIPRAIQAITYHLHDIAFRPRDAQIPLDAAIGALAAHVVVAIALVAYQVRRAHLSGVGGAS